VGINPANNAWLIDIQITQSTPTSEQNRKIWQKLELHNSFISQSVINSTYDE